MKRSSAFAAITALIVGVLALSASAYADPQPLEQIEQQHYSNQYADIPPGYAEQRYVEAHAHYRTYTGSTEQAPAKGVRYLTYSGNTEQAPAQGVRYLTYSGNTEQVQVSDGPTAEQLRGRALNATYGNAWTKMSSSQFAALVSFFGNDVTQYSPKQLKTFVLRGEKGVTLSAPSSNGFDFRDFGIGIAAAIAAMLAVGVVRRGRRTPTLEGAHGAA